LTTFGAARIRYRGVVFGYQQQQIFWQAIERYLLQTAHEVFKRWDIETKTHSTVMRLRSIDGVERHLRQFVHVILQMALDDRERRARYIGEWLKTETRYLA